MKTMKVLYAKDKKGSLLRWACSVEDGSGVVRVEFGKLDGKTQIKETLCSSKNIGKSNETTPYQQALLEMASKVEAQRKKGYFETQADALAYVEKAPMLLQNHNKHESRIKYPCMVQTKMNGVRMMRDSSGNYFSKTGGCFNKYVPKHIKDELDVIDKNFPLGVDGEVYREGLPLQLINSAFKKHNDITPTLGYVIYDVPDPKCMFIDRIDMLKFIEKIIKDNGLKHITVHIGIPVVSSKEADVIFNNIVESGGEGVVYRNYEGMYEFGTRSYDAIKRKNRQTTEAFVVSAVEDKNSQAVLTCMLENGVYVDCMMLKKADPDVNLRLYENKDMVVGKYIEIEYEELSIDGVPTKAVGQRVRPVDIVGGRWVVRDI